MARADEPTVFPVFSVVPPAPGSPCDADVRYPRAWGCPYGLAARLCTAARIPRAWNLNFPSREACDDACVCPGRTSCVSRDRGFAFCLPTCRRSSDCRVGQVCHRLAFTQTRVCIPPWVVDTLAQEVPPTPAGAFWRWVPPKDYRPPSNERFLPRAGCRAGDILCFSLRLPGP
jgi:hypothetical protein